MRARVHGFKHPRNRSGTSNGKFRCDWHFIRLMISYTPHLVYTIPSHSQPRNSNLQYTSFPVKYLYELGSLDEETLGVSVMFKIIRF